MTRIFDVVSTKHLWAVPLLFALAVASSGCRSGADIDHLNNLKEWSNFFYEQGANPEHSRQEALGAYHRSQRLARMYLEERPRDLMARTILGYTYIKLGPWMSNDPAEETAESSFKMVLEREPGNYRAHMGLGLVYFQVSRRLDRGRLDDFSRALQAVEMFNDKIAEHYEAELNDPERASTLNEAIMVMFHDFSRDLRHFADGRTFPWERYKGLVNPEEIAGTRRTPSESMVRNAIRERIDQLLQRMQRAQRRLPADHSLFKANLDRVEVLLRVAYDHYRAQYLAKLDRALHHFHLCEQFHHRDQIVFHWVYEYMALAYMLKASVYERGDPPSSSSSVEDASATGTQPIAMADADSAATEVRPDERTIRRQYMVRAIHYFERFHEYDRHFEDRRIERLNDPRVDNLRNDEFFTHRIEGEMVVEDFRRLMRELIDQARVHRQAILQMMIDLHLHEFGKMENFERVLELCDHLADAEVMLSDDRDIGLQPVKHFFFRGEARRYMAEELERQFERDRFGDLVIPQEGELAELHRDHWRAAQRHYQTFLERASIRGLSRMREITREALSLLATRYPDMTN